MGTVEHFDETDHELEGFRVLRSGGTAVIGVPNRHDPFLRPLFVAVLYRLGFYGYGFEKASSPAFSTVLRMVAARPCASSMAAIRVSEAVPLPMK